MCLYLAAQIRVPNCPMSAQILKGVLSLYLDSSSSNHLSKAITCSQSVLRATSCGRDAGSPPGVSRLESACRYLRERAAPTGE